MSHTDTRLTLVRQLHEVTHLQIAAARTLQHRELEELNARYSDLVFQLRVAMQGDLPQDQEQLELLRQATLDLGKSQERLAFLSGSVVSILNRVLPGSSGSPGTYGRDGQLMAG
mgnify:CR=1 FL=1